MKKETVAAYIDHTLLKPEAVQEQFDTLCDEAIEYGFWSVCINSSWVSYCVDRLSSQRTKVCTVVGFPLGAMSRLGKRDETRHAIDDGADEIDMVINIGAIRSGNISYVTDDIRTVRSVCTDGIVLKVIIETALLTDDQKVSACKLAVDAGADFVKTSTGFSHHGATLEDVRLMRNTVGPSVGVKAAGGVRSMNDALAMIDAGATRIGTSNGVDIVRGTVSDGGY